ncbi:tetratricopeptide repeat protein [Bacillus carboniphilus]|uniref:Tetratricopeptide repeat protein n=1 Tax=Bacillus carboniphilus TaxID=86663 RepID=A0ABN0W9J9_9BACI
MELLERAISLREEKKFEEARDILLSLHNQYPEDPNVSYQCAWVHDNMGLESEAIPYYIHAIEHGLNAAERRGALLGLGSTYRTLGLYTESKTILEQGLLEYPDAQEFAIFYAMTLYNLGESKKAMEILLTKLIDLTANPDIKRYEQAIRFYADKLDQIWK